MTTPTDTHHPASESPAPAALAIAEHVAALAAEGQRFAAAARSGAMDAPVAACPGWNLRDLVRHLGEIHLWAAANVAQRPGAALDLEDRAPLAESWPDLAVFWPADDDLVDWYCDTNANLVSVLETVPPEVSAPTFLPAPSPLAMWARRQAHETSIHRLDAEVVADAATGFDPAFAADGVDELLYGFYESVERPPERRIPLDRDHLMRVYAHDTGDNWFMTIGPAHICASPGGGVADLTITGTASDLYAALWNRGDAAAITASGERRLLQMWHDHTGVRWELA